METEFRTEERIRVRYGETDQMGHAYYGNYFLWFNAMLNWNDLGTGR